MIIILDTNILISAVFAEHNYGAQIMRWVVEGELDAVVSRQTLEENKLIMRRAIRKQEDRDLLQQFFRVAKEVTVRDHVQIVVDDPEDDKFFSLAKAAGADYIITNDAHLLDIEEFASTKVVRPEKFVQIFQEQQDPEGEGAWSDWIQSLMRG